MPTENEVLAKHGVKPRGVSEEDIMAKYIKPPQGAQETRMSDYFPSLYTEEKGLTLKAKKGGLLDASPSKIAGAASDVAEKIERYGRAPMRSAINTAMDKGLAPVAIAESFVGQFGADPKKAPTGKALASRLGVEDTTPLSERIPWAFTEEPGLTLKAKKGGLLDVSPQGLVGGVIEEGLDPTLAISSGKQLSKLAVSPKGLLSGAEKAKQAFGRAHLRPTPKFAEDIGEQAIKEAVDESLRSGAIQFGGKAKDTAANLRQLKQEVGAVKGDITNASKATVDPKVVTRRIRDEIALPLEGVSTTKKTGGRVKEIADDIDALYPEGPISLAASEKEKAAYQKLTKYAKGNRKQSTMNDARGDIARVWREEGDRAADLVGDTGFKEAKKSYQNLENASKMAGRTARLTQGGLLSKITDTGLQATALPLALSHPVEAAATVIGRMATKGRISSAGAVTMDKLITAAQKSPEILKDIGVPLDQFVEIVKSKEGQAQLGRLFRGGVTASETERRRKEGLLR